MAEKHIHYYNGAQPPKPTFERKAESLKKIMLIFIIIIFSGMLLVYSVSDIPDSYVSEMVGINDNKLNAPIAELNGLTLNELFELLPHYDLILPNGVNSYDIRYDNGVYVLDRYVQEKTLVLADVNFSMLTTYTDIDYLRISKPLDYISYGGYTNSNFILENYSTGIVSLDGIVNVGKWTNTALPNQTIVGFPKGTLLTTAQSALIGLKIYYQLAIPLLVNDLQFNNLTKEQMDYYYEQYKTYKDTNIQVKVYKDNWTLEQKERIGTGGLTAVTGFMRQVEKVGVTIGTAKDIFVNIIENDIIRTISNTLQDISNGIRDFFEWVSDNLGFENKLPPITLPIPPINP